MCNTFKFGSVTGEILNKLEDGALKIEKAPEHLDLNSCI
jgi:hypothetical protein